MNQFAKVEESFLYEKKVKMYQILRLIFLKEEVMGRQWPGGLIHSMCRGWAPQVPQGGQDYWTQVKVQFLWLKFT